MTSGRIGTRLAACLAAALVVAVTTWPPGSFVGHAHWDQVAWIPFTGLVRPFDVAANVLLFMPLGWTVGASGTRHPVRRAVVTGALLSMAVELFQVYTHGHFPTMTDVTANTVGAWLGARLRLRRHAPDR